MNNIPLPIVITIAFIILAIITIIVWFQFIAATRSVNRLIERLKKHNQYQLTYERFMLKALLDNPELQKNEQFQTILHKLNEEFYK